MFWRTTALAGAAAMIAAMAVPAQADTAQSTRCEEMNFRVYFDADSAQLNDAARDTLRAAQRHVQGCSYAELHVRADPGALSAQRGRTIVAAMNGRSWNVTRIERPAMTREAAFGPDYVQVLMSPNHVPATPALDQGAGV